MGYSGHSEAAIWKTTDCTWLWLLKPQSGWLRCLYRSVVITSLELFLHGCLRSAFSDGKGDWWQVYDWPKIQALMNVIGSKRQGYNWPKQVRVIGQDPNSSAWLEQMAMIGLNTSLLASYVGCPLVSWCHLQLIPWNVLCISKHKVSVSVNAAWHLKGWGRLQWLLNSSFPGQSTSINTMQWWSWGSLLTTKETANVGDLWPSYWWRLQAWITQWHWGLVWHLYRGLPAGPSWQPYLPGRISSPDGGGHHTWVMLAAPGSVPAPDPPSWSLLLPRSSGCPCSHSGSWMCSRQR